CVDRFRHEIMSLPGHTDQVLGLGVSDIGDRIASASMDGTVRLWNSRSGQLLHVFTGHKGTVHAVAFSPDGKKIASAGSDRTIRIWAADSGTEVKTIPAGEVTLLAFRPDGRVLASASGKSPVENPGTLFWDPDTGDPVPL